MPTKLDCLTVIISFFKQAIKGARDHRAGIALIIALSAPMLIGATGLAVDVGYWYQQQESLQTAADSAALSAATAGAKYSATTAAAALPYAVAGANAASNNQFNFTTSTVSLATPSATTNAGGATATTWVATLQIPRASFFSGVKGMGFAGSIPGTQYASASATVVASTGPVCLYAGNGSGQTMYASGGAKISATNCNFYSNSTACAGGDSDSIAADPSGQIIAKGISTAGCTYANTSGGAYVGVSGGSSANGATTGYKVTNNAPVIADPMASTGGPPSWPSMPSLPAAPSESGSAVNVSAYASNAWNNASVAGVGDCIYEGGAYSGNCELYPHYLTGLNSINAASLLLNEATSTGTSYITGGLGGGLNTLTMNGNYYYITGGYSLSTNTALSIAAGTTVISGGATFTNGTETFGNGTYYLYGATNAGGTTTGWGMNLNAPSLTGGGGTYYVNGGAYFGGSNAAVTFGQGTYMFSAHSGGSAALDDSNANITFTGGTYFFNGGLTVEGNGTVSFGPGIYYVENGNLNFSAGSHVTATGATFVLEGTAGYELNGGSAALNLTAPSTGCVAPASYPESAYAAAAPYDGTNGEGICGIIIYQARSDTTADQVSEGANSTVNGIIYALNGSLSVSGGANISASSSSATLAIITSTISDTGSGTITLSAGTGSGLGGAGTSQTLLTN